MQFTRLALVAGVASLAQAKLELTDTTYAGITAGEEFEITWTGAQGDVSLILLDDSNPNDNHPIATIASGLTGTSYAWTPSETLINLADYALQVKDSVTSNDGAQFQLLGGATASPTGASTSATAATTTADSTTVASTTLTTSTTPSSTAAPSTTSATTSASNSTMTLSKTSSSPSSTSAAAGSQTSAPSAANNLASPLALIFLTVAALFLN